MAAHIVESNIKYPNLFGVTFWKDKRTTEKVRNLQCENTGNPKGFPRSLIYIGCIQHTSHIIIDKMQPASNEEAESKLLGNGNSLKKIYRSL